MIGGNGTGVCPWDDPFAQAGRYNIDIVAVGDMPLERFDCFRTFEARYISGKVSSVFQQPFTRMTGIERGKQSFFCTSAGNKPTFPSRQIWGAAENSAGEPAFYDRPECESDE